jgi:two-component system, NarL family, sensor kinase
MTAPVPSRTRRPVVRAVATFAAAGVIALIGVALASSVASRRAGTDAAIRDARRDTSILARTAIAPLLTDGLLGMRPAAVAAMDAEVRQRVLDHDLVRVKIWRQDGLIVYSDEKRLIGEVYQLGADEQLSFTSSAAAADVSDLSRPENRYERPFGKLLEVYQPVRTPTGQPLLFETYFRYDAVSANGRRAWNDFAPIMLFSLVGLEALQIPLAWSMTRRLHAGQERQEVLRRRAIEASDAERRRIARDLHDGVVQDLASVSYSLASVHGKVDNATRVAVDDAAAGTRRSIRALRSLLVEIYPPSLRDAGLGAALSDLTAPLLSHGIEAHVELPEDLRFPPDVEALLYRATQEAVRNVVAHAGARHVEITLHRPDHRAVLDVSDDGVGFDASTALSHPVAGHVGLRVLTDLVGDAGGLVEIKSEPGAGSRIHVEVPTA